MGDTDDLRVSKDDLARIIGGMIKVVVGRRRAVFFLHENLASERTPIFEAERANSRDHGIDCFSLPSEDENVFETYVQYIYTGKIACKEDEDALPNHIDECATLIDLYALGDHIDDTRLMDDVTSTIIAMCRKAAYSGNALLMANLTKVYERTGAGSLLRQLVVDKAVYSPQLVAVDKRSPHEFLIELSRALLEERKKSNSKITGTERVLDACVYHHHEADEVCSSKKRKWVDADDD